MTQRLTDTETAIEKLIDETQPFEREYSRRSGWSRYYRVTSSTGGHVHRSMHCSTCYPTTVYGWLPNLSGKGQDEAVDSYGSEMCSHCFPGVLTHPSYQTRGRIAEAAAAARATERATRDAAKAAKAISQPNGQPLKIGQGRFPETIRTEVTAERTLVDRLAMIRSWYSDTAIEANLTSTQGEEEKARYRAQLVQNRENYQRDVTVLAEALAAKRNTTTASILENIESKVTAKIRRDSRK
jgi:hypothetical protein